MKTVFERHRWATRLFYSLTVMLVVALTGCDTGKDLPKSPTVYKTLGGAPVSLEALKGKVVLINYWAIWCSPCRQEIPELNALQQEYPEQVKVLGVNFDGVTGQQLQDQVTRMGIAFTQLEEDPRDAYGVAASGVLPETLVIDRRGEFQQVLLGPQTLHNLRHVVASLPEEMTEHE